jgi:transcriptional/translational regulatory protein YebC/TACO1
VIVSDDVVEVYTDRNNFAAVSQALQSNGFTPDSALLIMQPNTTLELDSESGAAVLQLVEALEDLDDVNQVSHNLELTDALVAQYA